MPWKWFKEDYYGLAYYVSSEAKNLLPLAVNASDFIARGQIDAVVKAIYDAMLAEGVNYALETIPRSERDSDSVPYQWVRTPPEILALKSKRGTKEGTCLDLALFFCGVCLGYGLLPILILLESHVLVAVSRDLDLRQWELRNDKEADMFRKIPVGQEHAGEI